MISSVLINNYEKSLQQKYNAVCFDIDGTLTRANSKKIDEKVLPMLAILLKKRVPVVFITGRGEVGLQDLKNDIYIPLRDKYGITSKEFARLYYLSNDGARLFYTGENVQTDILNNSMYISTDEQLEQLNIFNNLINTYLIDNSLCDICKINYSFDKENNRILNIRIVFNNKDDKLFNLIFSAINDIILNNKLGDICLSHGVYKGTNVIQIGTAKKEIAIEKVEKIIGIPQKSMIRIGDCGDLHGNDYSMLNCEQGFSVDKTSGDNNCCFPIIDDNGQILKGVDGVLYLISKAKILPTVCLESVDKDDYTYKYAYIEQQMVKGRNGHLKHFNDLVNEKFDLINGINDLFDEFSGSIKIPMYEWELIKNNPLKDFWNMCIDGNLVYSLRDDNNYLLRGSKTYYYFLANRQSIDGNDVTSFNNVIEWYNNNLKFIKNAYDAVLHTSEMNNPINNKLVLGLLDNIRNILLVIINHNLNNSYLDLNILINLNDKNNSNFYSQYKLISIIHSIMSKVCFIKDYKLSKLQLLDILNIVYGEIYYDYSCFKKSFPKTNYSKEFRAYREIDNFAQNYITLKLSSDKGVSDFNCGICGMCYGGIELPILYKTINKNVDDILILKFSRFVSGYTNKQLVDLRKFNIEDYGGLLRIGDISFDKLILFDDNILTGKTMQLAINLLYDSGFSVDNIGIVRYPSINRVNQMFMNNHGAVDYNLFFDYILGLCFNSPYSWRDENEFSIYEDSLGVFDLNRKKIIECLIKNHDFGEDTEVGFYKRRIKK